MQDTLLLLFILVGSEPAPMHCSSSVGNMHSPVFSIAVPTTGSQQACVNANALTKICSLQSSAVTQHQQILRAALQNMLTAGLCP